MQTARMSSPPLMMESRTSAAVESAVDAFATRVLSDASPAEACVDESLGPYITSLLRCSLHEMDPNKGVSSIPEYDSLIELLEEHCSLDEESATAALTTLATAVKTGIVPESQTSSSFRNQNPTMEATYRVDPDTLFSVAAETNDNPLAEEDFPPLSEAQNTNKSSEKDGVATPLKENRLIPVDLLGALDDPSSPLAANETNAAEADTSSGHDETFPPLGTTAQMPKKRSSTASKGKKSSKKQPADDLAAALFRSSRVRQSSIDSDNVSKSTSAGSGGQSSEAQQLYHSQYNQYFQQQWDMAVEMLLTMNHDLSEEAAAEAALMANGDPYLAQYVINQALQAPPVCRHMLNDHCYRSDCQYNHDVEGHTCLFWIRGRCGKGPSCRFLHGFSDKSLDGIQEAPVESSILSPSASSTPLMISTGNLVSHNMNAAFSAPQHDSDLISSFQPSSLRSNSGFDNGSFSMPSSWATSSPLETAMHSMRMDDKERRQSNESSFASIASKGYSGASFTPEEGYTISPGLVGAMPVQKEKTVRIPQDLWNPHINRDAHVFHIPDPMERYEAVCATVSRDDVVDLHFQSTKTFGVVLADILPRKLRDYNEVWVVTGTGHHVGSSTHQKGGGALESAVLSWLAREGYDFVRGRDRNGHTGAILVTS